MSTKQEECRPNIRLSVVTPAFNAVRHLDACVANVAREWVEGVEHLVIDGGSTDGSLELLTELALRHQHLRFISEPDRGQSDALNKGVRMAGGGILGILNVDDYYEPGVLRRVLDIFAGLDEPSFVVGNCSLRWENGSLWFVNRPRHTRPWQLLLGSELVQFPFNPSAYFYHRRLHERVGPYDEGLHYAMDLDFILRAAQECRFRYFDEAWGNFCLSESCKTVASGPDGPGLAERDAVYRRWHGTIRPPGRWIVALLFEITHSKLFYLAQFVWRRPDLAALRAVYHLRRLAGLRGGADP